MNQSSDRTEQNNRMMQISTRSFATAFIMVLVIMVFTYILTFIIPSGCYLREEINGQTIILPDTYALSNGGISFSDWVLSPIKTLTTENGPTILALLVFLLVIGGSFNALDACGILRYMLSRIYATFRNQRYRLLTMVTLFFMSLGALVGSFEECVPMVPIAVALAYSMGWDALVGLGMSILAVGCGFSTGVLNPFTVGIAQRLAGLPMFSGISMRLLSFAIVYGILLAFLIPYAKRIESDPKRSIVYDEAASRRWMSLRVNFNQNTRMDTALIVFVSLIGLCAVVILLSAFVAALQSVLMPIIAAAFLIAGISASLVSGMPCKSLVREFLAGIRSMLPAIVMIPLASSVRYTLETANVLDTILYRIASLTAHSPNWIVALLIFLLVLIMNLFISSGSAKAFLLMPLIVPITDITGVSRQLSVLAFAYGDGFSNMFYPTNPVLLISLGIVGISYTKWVKWSWKFQLVMLLLSAVMLLLANAVGY